MHRFDPSQTHRLTDADRPTWFPSTEILCALSLACGATVLDFGSGPGYLSLPVGQQIGSSGTVIAADVEPIMLETLMQRAQQMNISNVYPILINDQTLPLGDDTIDRVLLSLILHEIQGRSPLFAELKRTLDSDGRIVIVEWQPWVTERGPEPDHRVSPEQLSEELRAQKLAPKPHAPLGEDCYILTATHAQ
jgi:ubiquinone/menaquinone biosynthesis C-methylase UbiE